ncbi:hypothetical protein IPG41_01640 [Candidatus Peregrinibacteria bacterium]|nr:MAG: hypothetical protein IPG41_01640 [Candidatus Peregrinibacteria bacterium]
MSNNLKSVLTNIGLSKKEAAVYLANLELGTALASEIAKKSKLNRVTTYDVLEKLISEGLVSSQMIKKVSCFTAMEPDQLRLEVRKHYLDFKEALPEFRRLQGKSSHPHIRYYEGLDGVKKIYADTLSSKTEILNYADSKSIREFWPKYDQEYVKKRVEAKIYLRGIAPLDEHGKKVAQQNESMYREIRLVKAGPFSFTNEINIYNDKVAIVSFSKNTIMGMIIESEEVANTQRAIFMMAWEFAESTGLREVQASQE